MDLQQLTRVAQSLVEPGRGILAADESSPTIKKRFDSIGLESTEPNRRAYRDMLFTTPGAEKYISGVILFDETLRQGLTDGTPFAKVLADRGIVPGIKVDAGAKNLAGHAGEKVTEGLDGLRDRLAEYYALGARFAKWRSVITIGDGIPSNTCIDANAHGLARYAALCQEANIVPIVEPEVLMDGDHSIERCEDVTTHTLVRLYEELHAAGVVLEGTLLKPNMVISGKGNAVQAGPEDVAAATIRCFTRTVPAAVPGIVFLSGGQSEQQATENLNAMNARGAHPWELSFSYGRALQESALKAWDGKTGKVAEGQATFAHRARMNGAARYGKYSKDMESQVAA